MVVHSQIMWCLVHHNNMMCVVEPINNVVCVGAPINNGVCGGAPINNAVYSCAPINKCKSHHTQFLKFCRIDHCNLSSCLQVVLETSSKSGLCSLQHILKGKQWMYYFVLPNYMIFPSYNVKWSFFHFGKRTIIIFYNGVIFIFLETLNVG